MSDSGAIVKAIAISDRMTQSLKLPLSTCPERPPQMIRGTITGIHGDHNKSGYRTIHVHDPHSLFVDQKRHQFIPLAYMLRPRRGRSITFLSPNELTGTISDE